MSTALHVRGLRKAFGGNSVLKGVDLVFEPGQIHALLGPNGAGKSTTLACVTGGLSPDDGEIVVGGRSYSALTPRTARDAGIAIIHQHAQLAADLTIADNIYLGRELRTRFGGVDVAAQVERSREALASLGVELDVRRRVSDLAVGEQQLVEIARALLEEPEVLILDEPTAALSDGEIEHLLATMKRLAVERGLVIIFVTHILREVMEAADVVTVIRDGVVLWTRPIDSLSMSDLIEGISPNAPSYDRTPATVERQPLVELSRFDSGFTGPLDLTIGKGEIVGLFGVLGSGRTDLLEAIAGVRAPADGSISIGGKPYTARTPRAAVSAGVALVPSDRKAQAIFGDMPALENLLMPHYGALGGGIRNIRAERQLFRTAADAVHLLPPDPKQEGGLFSGGNAQKLVLSRWVTGIDPKPVSLLLLDDPTQGVDVGSRYEIYDLIRAFVAEGDRSVVFASNEPEEALMLADRIVVLSEGRVVDIRHATDLDEQSLLTLAHH